MTLQEYSLNLHSLPSLLILTYLPSTYGSQLIYKRKPFSQNLHQEIGTLGPLSSHQIILSEAACSSAICFQSESHISYPIFLEGTIVEGSQIDSNHSSIDYSLCNRYILSIYKIKIIKRQHSIENTLDIFYGQAKIALSLESISLFLEDFQIDYYNLSQMADEYIGQWSNIPKNAFRYFPRGEQIIIGNEEKQWRKIFEGGQTFNTFQNQALAKLDKRLQEQRVVIDPWFDEANKLRFLQANKFKTSKTIDSMTETSKWRSTNFPFQMDYLTEQLLNSGAFYFCGRDDKYRPILVVDIGKFTPDADEDNDCIQKALVIIMEFMIKQLLIEGQVENYVLIMNLEKATFGLRGIIMKILSFTSNAYRGRLFASYILSMPTLIRWGWDAIVSKFVSENTLKKLKISGDPYNDEMWTHISKKTVEVQYNGQMPNLTGPFWPPRKQHLLFTDPQRQVQNGLISVDQYVNLFKEKRLFGRKILKKYIVDQLQTISAPLGEGEDYIEKSEPRNSHVIPIRDYGGLRESSRWKAEVIIKKETPFEADHKIIQTFFQLNSFKKICKIDIQQQ